MFYILYVLECKSLKRYTPKYFNYQLRENIEPSLVALGCKNPFGWPIRKLSAFLNRGEKKRGREFELRKLNDRTLQYIWYTVDHDNHCVYHYEGSDH